LPRGHPDRDEAGPSVGYERAVSDLRERMGVGCHLGRGRAGTNCGRGRRRG
jgi:hypothetical protein